jgi:hypothetical protein
MLINNISLINDISKMIHFSRSIAATAEPSN